MRSGDRELWRVGEVCCSMRSCCSGAELQVRRGDDVVLRELYPTKSDLFERALMLKRDAVGLQSLTPQSDWEV